MSCELTVESFFFPFKNLSNANCRSIMDKKYYLKEKTTKFQVELDKTTEQLNTHIICQELNILR